MACDMGVVWKPCDALAPYVAPSAQSLAGCVCMPLLYIPQDGVTRSRARPSTRSLPDWALSPDAAVFLNIPMDAETPRLVCWFVDLAACLSLHIPHRFLVSVTV